MKYEEVKNLLVGVTPGTQLRLRFNKDHVQFSYYLIPMSNQGIIEFENAIIAANIWVAFETKNWQGLPERTVDILLTRDFDLEWFLDKISYPLESLEVLDIPDGEPLVVAVERLQFTIRALADSEPHKMGGCHWLSSYTFVDGDERAKTHINELIAHHVPLLLFSDSIRVTSGQIIHVEQRAEELGPTFNIVSVQQLQD